MRLRLDPSSQSGLSPEPPKPTRGQVNGYVAKTERLGELLDVVIASTPLDNQALAYDTATSKWIPQTISGGGGGQVDSVVAGTGIAVDATDPTNPIAALSTGSIASLALADTATQPGDLATVATTGAYSDLTGAPTIPVISDTAYNATTWNANTDGATKNAIRDKVETMDTAIALNTAKNTYPSADATKVGHISVTQAVNLDTMESDIATNNAKITYPSSASTKLATIETNADVTDAANVAAAGAAIPTGTPDGTKFLRDDSVWTAIPGGGDALTANPLSQFASTTSAQLAGVISNETGSGALVFGTSPTLVTPALGTPSALVGTNITGTAAGLTVGATTGVEAGADVTDTANVTSAGALMDSEVTNLAQVKAFDSTDYAAALGADDNYVTDAEKTVIGNTSGTNTGDQDLSGLQPKTIIVTSTTARTTAAKVGTTVGGSYTPTVGDQILVTFTLGIAVNAPTLNIDGSGAVNLSVGGVNVTTSLLSTGAVSVVIPLEYSGTHWLLEGSQLNTNTTYSEISDAEINTGTASTSRAMSGRRATTIVTKARDGRVPSTDGARLDAITDADYLNTNTTKANVGLGNVDNTSDQTKNLNNSLYNVKDYGATGDGTTDDTTNVQSAIDAAGAVGGTVFFPTGVYVVTPLDGSYNHITFAGEGRASEIRLKPIDLSSGAYASFGVIEIKGTSMTRIVNPTVRDLFINGNIDNQISPLLGTVDQECIHFEYVVNGTIANCYIRDSPESGIDLDYSNNCMIVNNHSFDNRGNGIHISLASFRNIVMGNYVEGNGTYWSRNGIDQWSTAYDNLFIGNIAISNHRNYKIDGEGATFTGNQDISSTNASTLVGVGETWTPTWTNFTTGNGVLNFAKFERIGGGIRYQLKFTLGSTSSVTGALTFSAPKTISSDYAVGDTLGGTAAFEDSGTATFTCSPQFDSTTTIRIRYHNRDNSPGVRTIPPSATAPFTWTTNDIIHVDGFYRE